MNTAQRIAALKKKLGDDLCILAHHYQSDAVVAHAHILGDSLELARRIDKLTARHIVFCGVHFMAETASILARSDQRIHIPEKDASCVMANMVPAPLAETVLDRLCAGGAKIIPLTYVNSSAAVKAICGRYGGSVCTSANASTMLRWALEQGDGVLFLPDANLGQNTAHSLGLDPSQTMRLDIRGQGRFVFAADNAHQLYLWPGLCAIHAKFHPWQIDALKKAEPQARIIVHPECSPAVVSRADGVGSTSYIIGEVNAAPAGSVLSVGTEWNLVQRLRLQHPDKHIRPLRCATCSNMAKTTETGLAQMLETLDTAPPVHVAEDIAVPARLALTRMLSACS